MNVIITQRQLDWVQFNTYKRLADVPDWSQVVYLIYNESSESQEDVFAELSRIPQTVKGILYVSDYMLKDNRGDALFAYFKSKGAYIYTDVDEIFSQEDMLIYIINNLGEVGTELAAPNDNKIDILSYYVNKLSKGETSSACISAIDGYVKDLGTDIQLAELATKRMSASLIDISKSIKELSKKEVASHDKLIAFSTRLEEMASNANNSGYIAPYNVPFVIKNVSYIKAYGDVPYLVSFFKYYCSYLRNVEQIICKLLIIRPLLLVYDKLYARDKTIFKLDSNNVKTSNISNHNNFVTYEPVAKVFDKFYSFEDNVDMYFVLDLTQQTTEIMQGHMVTPFAAYSSVGAYEYLKASGNSLPDLTHSFFSDVQKQGALCIPKIADFSSISLDLRDSKHYASCQALYNQLNNLIGV